MNLLGILTLRSFVVASPWLLVILVLSFWALFVVLSGANNLPSAQAVLSEVEGVESA